jgi:hypothetical protein
MPLLSIGGHIIAYDAAQQEGVTIIGVSNFDRVDATGIGTLYVKARQRFGFEDEGQVGVESHFVDF